VEALINIRVAARGLRIAEVASVEARRLHGVSNLNAVSDGLRVLRTILREFRRARADRTVASLAGPPSVGGHCPEPDPVRTVVKPRPAAALKER
jgi:hypothetical protein